MSTHNFSIHIEYCGAWGYAPKANALKQNIQRQFADLSVETEVGRRSSFEISLVDKEGNRKLIYSKLQAGSFPDSQFILAKIVEENKVAAA